MKNITPLSLAKIMKPAPIGGGFSMDDYWVWCGSVIRGNDGKYHMFASRWSKKLPMFTGYVLASEVVRAVSDTPEGPYKYVEKVLPCSGENAWDSRMAHNPTIHRHGDTYLLFYIGSTYRGAMEAPPSNEMTAQASECYANIRIGLATSKSLEGPWKTSELPILEPRKDKWDCTIVTNPAPCVNADGGVVLFYRSNTPDGLRIGVAGAEHFSKPYERLADDPVLRFQSGDFVEDPFVWCDGDHYEMLAKDMLGGITGEVHSGAHFRSINAIDWEPVDPPKAYSRDVLFEDGQKRRLGCLERPQLLFDDQGKPVCFFAAAADGPGGFTNASRTWNIAIPLR